MWCRSAFATGKRKMIGNVHAGEALCSDFSACDAASAPAAGEIQE
jgi:hypothetical protein